MKNGFHGCQITVHSSTSNCIHIFRELFFAPQIPPAFNNGMHKKYISVYVLRLCTVLKVKLAKKALPGQAFFQRTRATQAKKKAKKIIRQTQRKLEKALCSLSLIHSLYK